MATFAVLQLELDDIRARYWEYRQQNLMRSLDKYGQSESTTTETSVNSSEWQDI